MTTYNVTMVPVQVQTGASSGFTLYNNGQVTVYVADNTGVSETVGYPVGAGVSVTLSPQTPFWCATASGTGSVIVTKGVVSTSSTVVTGTVDVSGPLSIAGTVDISGPVTVANQPSVITARSGAVTITTVPSVVGSWESPVFDVSQYSSLVFNVISIPASGLTDWNCVFSIVMDPGSSAELSYDMIIDQDYGGSQVVPVIASTMQITISSTLSVNIGQFDIYVYGTSAALESEAECGGQGLNLPSGAFSGESGFGIVAFDPGAVSFVPATRAGLAYLTLFAASGITSVEIYGGNTGGYPRGYCFIWEQSTASFNSVPLALPRGRVTVAVNASAGVNLSVIFAKPCNYSFLNTWV